MYGNGAPAVDYDVIIVGGRPAGASLAARLGALGHEVLVIDRATFPSRPAVPSNPVVYASAMRLLDEIGFGEDRYADVSLPIRRFAVEFDTHFSVQLELPEVFGRRYIRSLDRTGFDHALWRHLDGFPTVTAREGFSFIDLLRDSGGRVTGIEGRALGGPIERIRARCVIGADGRFSQVAQKAGARVVEEHKDHCSTVYYADWDDLEPFADEEEPLAHLYATGRGTNLLLFPMTGGRTTIATHQRADRVNVNGDAEAFYRGVLWSYPGIARRLRGAHMASEVVGIKRIGNRYHEAGGPGFMLVGDALHQKDPVDAQGIHDALVEAKVLAVSLSAFLRGERTFDEALADYALAVRRETHGMYLATMERLKRELYDEPPAIVIRTLLRWLMNDPEYQRRFFLFLSRAIPPEDWLPPTLVRDASLRGAMQDLRGFARQIARAVGRGPRDVKV